MQVYTLANYGRRISIEIYTLLLESLPEATWGIGVAGQTPSEVGAFIEAFRQIGLQFFGQRLEIICEYHQEAFAPLGTTALTGFLLESGGYNFDPKEISDGSRAEQSFGAS